MFGLCGVFFSGKVWQPGERHCVLGRSVCFLGCVADLFWQGRTILWIEFVFVWLGCTVSFFLTDIPRRRVHFVWWHVQNLLFFLRVGVGKFV